MKFTVEPQVFARIPGLRVVIFVCKNVEKIKKDDIDALFHQYWLEGAKQTAAYSPVQQHPHLMAC